VSIPRFMLHRRRALRYAGCSNVFAGGSFDRCAALPTDEVVCSLPALCADEVSPERLLHDEQSAMVIAKTAHETSCRSMQVSLICRSAAEKTVLHTALRNRTSSLSTGRMVNLFPVAPDSVVN
jgi:hypothetical protein